MTQLYTEGGKVLSEVISALQKTIRRGDEQQAMYWALEMVPRYEAYMFNRLCIIANEDIGAANPLLLVLVPQQRDLYMSMRAESRDGAARLILANTILLMCRSTKSRIADHFQCAVNQGRLQGTLTYEIPDFALDKHTGRGRKLGRGVDHFLDVGCALDVEDEISTPDPYKQAARELWSNGKFVETNWKKRAPEGSKNVMWLFGDQIEEMVQNELDTA